MLNPNTYTAFYNALIAFMKAIYLKEEYLICTLTKNPVMHGFWTL